MSLIRKLKRLLEENDIDFFPELILRREISLKGANRCFVNDTPVALSVIKDIGDLLVDLHGQHEHQSLLRTETHIDFLDEYAGTEILRNEYADAFKKVSTLSSRLNEFKNKESSLKEKKDFYAFQMKEIDAVSPQEREEEQISTELNILENSEKLLDITGSVYENLFDSENSIHDQLTQLKNSIDELLEIDTSFGEIEKEFESIVAQVRDVSEFIRKYNAKIDLDPENLERLRERLGSLALLKKKYGGSVEAVMAYREKIGREFDAAENYGHNIQSLEKEISSAREAAGRLAQKLSLRRKESAAKIEKEVVKVLAGLGIAESIFKIQIDQTQDTNRDDFVLINSKRCEANSKGIDTIEFYISTNAGENVKPLVKVASGGEISRIMLSLKTILAKSDKLPLLIFDEIDTGVSGRIAQKVGNSLKSLASAHQVIAITHLPQIAGQGDTNYVVEKAAADNRVTSSIRRLNEEEKIKEVAKLMSGENITEASLKGARELMGLH